MMKGEGGIKVGVRDEEVTDFLIICCVLCLLTNLESKESPCDFRECHPNV